MNRIIYSIISWIKLNFSEKKKMWCISAEQMQQNQLANCIVFFWEKQDIENNIFSNFSNYYIVNTLFSLDCGFLRLRTAAKLPTDFLFVINFKAEAIGQNCVDYWIVLSLNEWTTSENPYDSKFSLLIENKNKHFG